MLSLSSVSVNVLTILEWAVFGASEGGFNPTENKHIRKDKLGNPKTRPLYKINGNNGESEGCA